MMSPHPSIFNVIDRRAHRIKRKLIGQVLSERSMRVFEYVMMEQIDVFLENLSNSSRRSTVVNMAERTKYIGFDIVGLLAFGYQLNLQTIPDNSYIIDVLQGANFRLNVYMQYPFLAKLKLEVIVFFTWLLQKDSWPRLLQRMIKSRLGEERHAKHDLFSLIINSMDAPSADKITLNELWSEALFFFPAGEQPNDYEWCV